MHPVIEWKDNRVYMIDQRLLPEEEKYVEHNTSQEVADSIRSMVIRGAPAIGVAAAMGIALGFADLEQSEPDALLDPLTLETKFTEISALICSTRPTAVNLFWAVARMKEVFRRHQHDYHLAREKLIEEAQTIDREDVEINRCIGRNGQVLFTDGWNVLTHCNAGALATSGYGTALGVVRAAVEAGKSISVFADETRPYLQGARLTVWELQRDGIPVTLITDSMAGHVMQKGLAQAVIVGADRIAANGDTANKIGTFSLAVLARYHQIPFYVAAPLSTIDRATHSGQDIPIEERDKSEVIHYRGQRTARENTHVYNPAFDVTPAALITAIITEKGIAYPDFEKSLQNLFPAK